MIRGRKLEIALYLEGIYVPCLGVSVSSTINAPTVATITIPYVQGVGDPHYTTHVAIFYRYIDKPTAALDSYKLLFHGEVAGIRVSRSGINISWQLHAVDAKTYLNRMPSQYTWYLTQGDYPEYQEDYNFYGLPTDDEHSSVKSWFETRVPQVNMLPVRRDFNSYKKLSVIKVTSEYLSNRGSYIHQGTDYAASKDTPIFCPYDVASITLISRQDGNSRKGGWGKYIVLTDATKYGSGKRGRSSILCAHLNRYSDDVEKDYDRLGAKATIKKGEVIGYTGNTGTVSWHGGRESQYHLHLEYFPNGYWSGVHADVDKTPIRELIFGHIPRASGDIEEGNTITRDGIATYSLSNYIDGIVSLLGTTDKKHSYYYNANQRFKILSSMTVVDYSNTFAAMWGAGCYSSYIAMSYSSLYKYTHTVWDTVCKNLLGIGYVTYSALAPKYNKEKNGLYEHFVTNDPIMHRPPLFNYISLKDEDSISFSSPSIPITALRYKSKVGAVTIDDIVSPEELHGAYYARGGSKSTDEEILYGANRVSRDMDYFIDAYMRDVYPDSAHGPSDYYQHLANYERATTSMRGEKIEVNLPYLDPRFVVGIPGAVNCPRMGVEYYGVVDAMDVYIDTSQGISQTRASMRYVRRMPNGTSYSAIRGIDPESDVDKAINKGAELYYRNSFYPSGQGRPIMAEEMFTDISALDMDDYSRDSCTMREYLTMYSHKNVEACADHLDAFNIWSFVETSEGQNAVPGVTYEINATRRIKIDKMSDMYIKERYEAVRAIALALMNDKIIIGG